VNKFTRGGISV